MADNSMQVFPPGTAIFEPDPIKRVVLMFPTQDDAIIFYELMRSLAAGEIELRAISVKK